MDFSLTLSLFLAALLASASPAKQQDEKRGDNQLESSSCFRRKSPGPLIWAGLGFLGKSEQPLSVRGPQEKTGGSRALGLFWGARPRSMEVPRQNKQPSITYRLLAPSDKSESGPAAVSLFNLCLRAYCVAAAAAAVNGAMAMAMERSGPRMMHARSSIGQDTDTHTQ